MPDEKTDEKKAEQTFGDKIAAQGYTACYIGEKLENLGNPNFKRATIGIRNALDTRLTSMDAPAEEWMRILTELAKRQAAKA